MDNRGRKDMEHKQARNLVKISLVLAAGLVLMAGCASAKPTPFVSDATLASNMEYVADVIVNKEGYHFLWFIPFSSATEDAARELMEQVVREKHKDAAGVFEYKKIQSRGVGIFDWKPTVTIMGKVARSR